VFDLDSAPPGDCGTPAALAAPALPKGTSANAMPRLNAVMPSRFLTMIKRTSTL
jgi:hypothetical protein